MPVNRLSPVKWVSVLAGCWLIAGFFFAASDTTVVNTGEIARLNKIVRVANAPGEGRLLIVGGSSAVAAFDSALLSRRLNRQVVNLAVSREAGDERILWELAKAAARPGDTVILSLRSFVSNYGTDAGIAVQYNKALTTIAGPKYHPITTVRIPWHAFPEQPLAGQLLDAMKAGAEDSATPAQCGTVPEAAGDITYTPRPPRYWQSVAKNINNLRTRNVTVRAAIPWTLVSNAQRDSLRGALKDAEKQLRKLNVELVEVSMDDDIRFDSKLFCDRLHLSRTGREVYSAYIAERL